MKKICSLSFTILFMFALVGCAGTSSPSVKIERPIPTPTTEPPSKTTTPATTSEIKLYYVAMSDEGKSGKAIGCGDSIVAVNKSIAPTSAPLTAALNELLANKEPTYGESGLSNSLASSDLKIESVDFAEGNVTLKLSGQFSLAGECDDPRVEAQIMETIMQFPTVKGAEVFVNGKELHTVLGGRGE